MSDSVQICVDDYLACLHQAVTDEADSYRKLHPFSAAIDVAARCVLPDDRKPDGGEKRHPHQYRIPHAALAEARHRLLENEKHLESVVDFRALHNLVVSLTRDIKGIGALTQYDIALRIGHHRKLEPEAVYLHAGTRIGAQKLGLTDMPIPLEIDKVKRRYPQLAALSAHHIEALLCIYKDDLDGARVFASRCEQAAACGCPPKAGRKKPVC